MENTNTAEETNPDLRFKFVSLEEWERWAQKQAPTNMGTHRGAWLEGEWAGYSQCMANEVSKRDIEIIALKKRIEELEGWIITKDMKPEDYQQITDIR